jgi:pyruvate,water dikinase
MIDDAWRSHRKNWERAENDDQPHRGQRQRTRLMSDALHLRWLDEIREADQHMVGSKMARLAELRRAGSEVPNGFAITINAFEHFVDANGLNTLIEREIASAAPDDISALEERSTHIRTLIEHAPLDAEFERALRAAYEELCFREGTIDLPVVVRSSATAEDGSGASFAGQYESYLGISGAPQVIDAVRRVWGSLFAVRAISYRLKHGQHHRETPMGVGVLRMLHARSAGVAFSVHPVTKKRDRIVIEGSWGLGEAFVQGLVEPDHIEVDKADGRIVEYRVGDKRIVSAYDHARSAVVERDMPERFRKEPSLTAEMVDALWRTIVSIESRQGHPVDIEWVFEPHWRAGRPVAVVQVRPVTALDEPEAAKVPQWNAANYAAKYGLGIKR